MFHASQGRAIPDVEFIHRITMTNHPLSEAYESLLNRAPAPLFQKARTLYMRKYALDGRKSESPLRLFVVNERLNETISPDPDAPPHGRIARLEAMTEELALVHWQNPEPADHHAVERYLRETWDLTNLSRHPCEEPWFREGGHQQRLKLPAPLRWIREAHYQDVEKTLRDENP